jgi:hypothetical protein
MTENTVTLTKKKIIVAIGRNDLLIRLNFILTKLSENTNVFGTCQMIITLYL